MALRQSTWWWRTARSRRVRALPPVSAIVTTACRSRVRKSGFLRSLQSTFGWGSGGAEPILGGFAGVQSEQGLMSFLQEVGPVTWQMASAGGQSSTEGSGQIWVRTGRRGAFGHGHFGERRIPPISCSRRSSAACAGAAIPRRCGKRSRRPSTRSPWWRKGPPARAIDSRSPSIWRPRRWRSTASVSTNSIYS